MDKKEENKQHIKQKQQKENNNIMFKQLNKWIVLNSIQTYSNKPTLATLWGLRARSPRQGQCCGELPLVAAAEDVRTATRLCGNSLPFSKREALMGWCHMSSL